MRGNSRSACEKLRPSTSAWCNACVICCTRGCFNRFSRIDKSFVERHSGLEQMAELLGKNEQLAVRNF